MEPFSDWLRHITFFPAVPTLRLKKNAATGAASGRTASVRRSNDNPCKKGDALRLHQDRLDHWFPRVPPDAVCPSHQRRKSWHGSSCLASVRSTKSSASVSGTYIVGSKTSSWKRPTSCEPYLPGTAGGQPAGAGRFDPLLASLDRLLASSICQPT
jgi:hypothetical protein